MPPTAMNNTHPVSHLRDRVRERRVEVYVGAVAIANLLVALAVVRVEVRIDHRDVNWWAFGVFAALLLLAETKQSFVLRFGEEGEITPGWAFAFALVLLGSPLLAMLCIATASVIADLLAHKRATKIIFNASQVSLSLGLGALVLALAGLSGPALNRGSISFAQSLGMVAGGCTVLVTSALLLFLVMAIVRNVNVRVPIREGSMTSVSADGALLAVAPILVIAVNFSLLLLPMLAVTSFIVFTSARQAVRQAYAASHDPLTGLINRIGFDNNLTGRLVSLNESPVGDGSPVGLVVLLIDLDGFKEVNDRLGHATGDALLSAFAKHMERVIPANAVPARLGGDEFAILIDGTASIERETMLVHELRDRLSQTLNVNGFPLTIGMSIGVACAPLHASTPEELLSFADVAMYRAKRCRTGVEVYGCTGEAREHGRIGLLAALSDAVTNDQLSLAYQPQVNMTTGRCDTVEALIRWQHPTLGAIAPSEFIAIAEHTDLIGPITEFVLQRAIEDIVSLCDPNISVAVNISARNLQDRHFSDLVLATLARNHLPANRLELEITESALASDPECGRFLIDALRSQGVRVAIDDFGTGYSSFASLRDVEVDRIKIDRSFVSRVTTGVKDEVLVRSLIRLSAELGLQTVAEGIEDVAAWDMLSLLGCDVGQGYLLGRPMPFADLTVWLARQATTAERQLATRGWSVEVDR